MRRWIGRGGLLAAIGAQSLGVNLRYLVTSDAGQVLRALRGVTPPKGSLP